MKGRLTMKYKINLKLVALAIIAVWVVTGTFTNTSAQESIKDLGEYGIEFEAVYTAEVSSTLSGGIKEDTVYLDNVDLIFSIDAEKLAKILGGDMP